ncbi:hypothetical protein E2562_031062 [Oryza meyeriana var. granulata]|uniref:Uncharacterized protein n=1 Tax=Oryza meyeriana var. granulata TaxID=110450 RepID=A0A6G1E4R3_9ORYZ|nr:hypothetical protein E2562_031062 [Oryza meyeriana var. granulata]
MPASSSASSASQAAAASCGLASINRGPTPDSSASQAASASVEASNASMTSQGARGTLLLPPTGAPTPRVLASPRLFPSRCHFASRSSGDEEEGDDDDHCDEEGSEDEWGEEEAVAAKPPSGKTEEEKVAEAAEIGYKVVGPLGADEKPFKPYEPVFAVVQVSSIYLFASV